MNGNWVTDNSVVGKKRRRIMNQMRDGIISPPTQIVDTKIIGGELHFNVPSTTGKSTKLMHNVDIYTDAKNDNIKFACNCSNKLGDHPSETCRHINMAMLKILTQYIDNAAKFASDKEQFNNVKKELYSVLGDFSALAIDDKHNVENMSC
jgi:hypothetical protein